MPFQKKNWKRYTKKGKKLVSAQTVKRMIKNSEETHIYDYSSYHTGGNTWSIICISNITKGDNVDNRSGDKVSPISINTRLNLLVNANSSTGDQMRIVMFKDKQARGAVPTSSDLGLTSNPADPFLNIDNYRGRFVKMVDRVISFDTTQEYKFLSINKKLSGKLQFGTEGDDYENNAIFIALWSKNDTNKATINFTSRLLFKDA